MKTYEEIVAWADTISLDKRGGWQEYERVKRLVSEATEDMREYEITLKRIAERMDL